MIISHTYRYLFIEIPLTASWAVHHELCRYYDGQPILHKHATYPEFQRSATDDEKNYFVLASVRNPLDTMVSEFLKLKHDHRGAFSNPDEFLRSYAIDIRDVEAYKQIQKTDATFESTLMNRRIWERPYSSMIEVSSKHLDFVIRYERLQEDFSHALKLLQIEQVRPIPIVNKTKHKNAQWEPYYTPPMHGKAMTLCGPFMQKWNYDFPPHWGIHSVSWNRRLEFRLVNVMKRIYLTRFRYSDKRHALLVRKLHARLRAVM